MCASPFGGSRSRAHWSRTDNRHVPPMSDRELGVQFPVLEAKRETPVKTLLTPFSLLFTLLFTFVLLSVSLSAAPRDVSVSAPPSTVEVYDVLELTASVSSPDVPNPFVDAFLEGDFLLCVVQ